METKRCLACDSAIRGRSDKRFCDDGCRNVYNNKLNSIPNGFVRQVNTILKKNRRILEEALGEEQTVKVPRDRLLIKGANLDYFTNRLADGRGQVYFFVYEYGYLHLEADLYLLVKQSSGFTE